MFDMDKFIRLEDRSGLATGKHLNIAYRTDDDRHFGGAGERHCFVSYLYGSLCGTAADHDVEIRCRTGDGVADDLIFAHK